MPLRRAPTLCSRNTQIVDTRATTWMVSHLHGCVFALACNAERVALSLQGTHGAAAASVPLGPCAGHAT